MGQSGTQLPTPQDDARGAELTTPNILRLLSAGASGSILMALGPGALRTKELTERVPGYAPRTVYRYASKLAQLGIVERHEEPGVPSKVVHSLMEPCGRELYDLVNAYANASLERLPNGEIGAHAWGSLALLADLWESGLVDELNMDRSLTELSRAPHDLSFHQVSRRTTLLALGGLIRETSETPRRRRYTLTDNARRAMALVAGIGRWRRHHVVPDGATGLSADEVGGLMRTVLPLVVLPEHSGKSFEMGIVPENGGGEDDELVWAGVEACGTVRSRPGPGPGVDASGHGKLTIWVDSVLDGPQKGLSVKGDVSLLAEFLQRLHGALWERPAAQKIGSAAPAPAR